MGRGGEIWHFVKDEYLSCLCMPGGPPGIGVYISRWPSCMPSLGPGGPKLGMQHAKYREKASLFRLRGPQCSRVTVSRPENLQECATMVAAGNEPGGARRAPAWAESGPGKRVKKK